MNAVGIKLGCTLIKTFGAILEPPATVLDGFTTNGRNVEDVGEDIAEWITELVIKTK